MRKSGWYSAQWWWWQSVRVGRRSENGLKCLAPFHAVLTSMTALTASSLNLSLSRSLSHLLSLDSGLLFLAPVFGLFLWKDGSFMGLWIKKFIVFHCVTPSKSRFPLCLVHVSGYSYTLYLHLMTCFMLGCLLDDNIDSFPMYEQRIWRQTN